MSRRVEHFASPVPDRAFVDASAPKLTRLFAGFDEDEITLVAPISRPTLLGGLLAPDAEPDLAVDAAPVSERVLRAAGLSRPPLSGRY